MHQFATLATKVLYCWKRGCLVDSAGIGLAGTSVIAYSILEAGGQEKIFTPLLGKGVKFFIGGKSADILHTDINNNLKDLKNSKDTLDQLKLLSDQVSSTIDRSDLPKQDKQSILSASDEVKKLIKL